MTGPEKGTDQKRDQKRGREVIVFDFRLVLLPPNQRIKPAGDFNETDLAAARLERIRITIPWAAPTANR